LSSGNAESSGTCVSTGIFIFTPPSGASMQRRPLEVGYSWHDDHVVYITCDSIKRTSVKPGITQ